MPPSRSAIATLALRSGLRPSRRITWEYVTARRDRGHTFFVPITEEMIGREIDVHVIGYDEDHTGLAPVVWLIPASVAPSVEMRTP